MPLEIYRIDTTLNSPDNMAIINKYEDEAYSFFRQERENIKIDKLELVFQAAKGYTKENLDRTDYIYSHSAMLFSKKFVEKVAILFPNELECFPCSLVCRGIKYEWYACRIVRKENLIDMEKTVFRTLSGGEKVIKFVRYKKDISTLFYIAKDQDFPTYFVVSNLFKELCESNGINIKFDKPEIF